MRKADPALKGLRAACLGLACLCFSAAQGDEARPAAADPALEARVQAVTEELRCLVCQNQTIADSHAGLAEDLKREVREQLQRGASEEQIKRYMVDRYGDFVLYRPPVKATTWLLWAGPALLLLAALLGLAVVLRRRSRLDAAQFEADPEEAGEVTR